MKQLVPRCQKRMQQSCKDVVDAIDCSSAWEFCWTSFASLFESELFRLSKMRSSSDRRPVEINAYDALRPW